MSERGNLGVLVHLADERPDLRVGEFADAVAEDGFVFGSTVSGWMCSRACSGTGVSFGVVIGRGRVPTPARSNANVIIGQSHFAVELSAKARWPLDGARTS